MHHPARALAIAIFLLGAGSSARAASAADEAKAKDAKEAKEHFSSGQTHYSLGEFTEAAAEFREAYRLLPVPAILFNIAQAMRQMNDFRHAYFYYSQYLSRRPDAANRTDVEGFISAMKTRMDEEDAQKSATASTAEPTAATANTSAQKPAAPTQVAHSGSAQSTPSANSTSAPASATATRAAPATKSAPASAPAAHGFWSGMHIAGVAAGGAAVAAGGLALAFHSSAASSAATLNQKYQAGTLNTDDAGLKSDVASKGTAATACLIGAAVLVAAGAVLVFAF